MKKSNLTFKIIAFIILTDLLESIYEFFFKKGMLAVGQFNFSDLSATGKFLINVISNGWIWMGLATIILETFFWFAILSKIDLSIAFSVGSSSYIFVLLFSAFLLHEQVSLNRWIGTALIILGIFLIAKSAEEKTTKTINPAPSNGVLDPAGRCGIKA